MSRFTTRRWLYIGLLLSAFLWVACKKKGGGSLVAKGKQLTTTKGCIACHSFDGSKKQGPTFKGLFGSKRTVKTGKKEQTITADEAYLKRAIQKPQADIVKGFEKAVMITVPVSDEEAKALIAFIKSLK